MRGVFVFFGGRLALRAARLVYKSRLYRKSSTERLSLVRHGIDSALFLFGQRTYLYTDKPLLSTRSDDYRQALHVDFPLRPCHGLRSQGMPWILEEIEEKIGL